MQLVSILGNLTASGLRTIRLLFAINPVRFTHSNRFSPMKPTRLLLFCSLLFAASAELVSLPLIIWHGLGDSFGNPAFAEVGTVLNDIYPGTYVYPIRVAKTPDADRKGSFFGNLTTQLNDVCRAIKEDPVLATAPAVNAWGFSQGGQFLRGYIERCNAPPVHNFVTMGSQHNGISDFQSCNSWLCRSAESLLKFGRWSEFVQSHLVPAQYFRDPEELEQYLAHSNFLADINNERHVKNETYKTNMKRLNRFSMYVFEDDKVVIPKESGFFAEVNTTSGKVTDLRQRRIYLEDWLGLKALDEQKKLEFLYTPGNHMQLSMDNLRRLLTRHFAPIEVKPKHNETA